MLSLGWFSSWVVMKRIHLRRRTHGVGWRGDMQSIDAAAHRRTRKHRCKIKNSRLRTLSPCLSPEGYGPSLPGCLPSWRLPSSSTHRHCRKRSRESERQSDRRRSRIPAVCQWPRRSRRRSAPGGTHPPPSPWTRAPLGCRTQS